MFNKYVLNNYMCLICVNQTHIYTYNRLVCILDHQKQRIYPQAGEEGYLQFSREQMLKLMSLLLVGG